LVKPLCDIADRYLKTKEKADGLNEYIVTNFPENSYALRAQKNLIKSYIASGDDVKTQAAVLKLANAFIDFPGQWDAVKRTADMLCDDSRFETATGMYRHLIATYPDDTDNVNWRKGLAIVKVNMGLDVEVENDALAMIADFNDNPELARAVFHIGEEYFFIAENYYKDRQMAEAAPLYQKALNMWELVIDRQDLEAFRSGQLYAFSAWSYYRLGEYIRAVEYFQKVADDWPGYIYGDNVQYMVGQCYESLKRSPDVAMSADEADLRIEAAYVALVERYPEKVFATSACMKLGRLYFGKEQWAEAIVYFEMYRQRQPDHYRFLYMLGQAYENTGDNEPAIAVYEEFLAKAGLNDHFRDEVQQKLDELKGAQ
jgi:tetratricopeptide (TPR) repeat protein